MREPGRVCGGSKGRRKLLGLMSFDIYMFTILIIVTVHAYVKAHLIMYFKYVQFNVFQPILIRLLFKPSAYNTWHVVLLFIVQSLSWLCLTL